MTKSRIVYFSQGGATAQVAESIATGLRNFGRDVELYNLINHAPPDLAGSDLLGIGFPVYYFQPPFIIWDYLGGLPDLPGLPAFVFITYGTYPGNAGTSVRRVLMHKKMRELGYFRSRGADYFLGYLKKGYLFSPGHPVQADRTNSEVFGRQLAARLAGAEYVRPAEDKPPDFIYRLQRLTLNRWLVRHIFARFFAVKKTDCTGCGLCVEICPTGNIHAGSDGRPQWGRKCLLCLYCEMRCPAEAITSPMSWQSFSPFYDGNIARAASNPELDYVRVAHRRGRTERLNRSES